MSNFNQMNKNPHQNCITTAYWCRDQNFRKYFEMRKKHGIEPSVNVKKFYNREKVNDYYNSLMEAHYYKTDGLRKAAQNK
jgi:hypothetical protein